MNFFDFLSWHYIRGSKFLINVISNFVFFAFHLFSVKLLFKTLFAPWRRVEIIQQKPGFSFEKLFNKLTFNLISRAIGFITRAFLISWGILLALIFIILGCLLLAVWQFLFLFSWPLYLLISKPKPKTTSELIQGEAKDFVLKRLGLKSLEELKKIDKKDLDSVLKWYWLDKSQQAQKKRFWQKENLISFSGLGINLAFGFTPRLDEYTQDLSFPPKFTHQLVGRKKEVLQIVAVLSRTAQNNVLLVGEPGVGKQTILLGLAKAIKENQVHSSLFYKRVLLLDMNLVLGKTPNPQEAKANFEVLLKEAQMAGNVILVINQIDDYVDTNKKIDLTSVFEHIAESSKIQLIGVTTPDKFEKTILPNEEFVKYFEKIEVQPPTQAEALVILQEILPRYENDKKVVVAFQALKEITDKSDELISHIPFPEKAVDLLDQLIANAHLKGETVVTKDKVDLLISQKLKVPVGSLAQEEKDKLKNLEPLLHQKVVDQDQAIKALVEAMQRSRAGISETEKPIGAFLFLGPTGVGKTETAKALAQVYFGSEKQMVRFDMSQPFGLDLFYQETRENPFSVLLLDEFEKAEQKTLNLFLTVFDEGYIKDNHGKIVSFKNMIIICTSNAAAEFIRKYIKTIRLAVRSDQKTNSDIFSSKVIEHVLQHNIFSPELINRFDGVVVYKPLSVEDVEKIAKLLVEKLVKRLAKKEITLVCLPETYSLLAKLGHSFEFGARPMKRLIADKIETVIAQKILNNEIKKGDRIKLTVDNQTNVFKIENHV